eukprot:13809988-Ditylum_brightwellii.AAC.1
MELMMWVAFSLRLYCRGATLGIIGASSMAGCSILSISHGINAGCQDGIGFVKIGSLVVTGCCCGVSYFVTLLAGSSRVGCCSFNNTALNRCTASI